MPSYIDGRKIEDFYDIGHKIGSYEASLVLLPPHPYNFSIIIKLYKLHWIPFSASSSALHCLVMEARKERELGNYEPESVANEYSTKRFLLREKHYLLAFCSC